MTVMDLLNHVSGVFNAVNHVFFDRRPSKIYKGLIEQQSKEDAGRGQVGVAVQATKTLSIDTIIEVINANQYQHQNGDEEERRLRKKKLD